FAQFGSELDEATQAQLNRGSRLTEVLKQDQYATLAVEKQILIIFAGTNGFLDDLPMDQVRPFERGLYAFLDQAHPGLGQKIREKKELDDALRNEMTAVIREYKERFRTERASSAAAH